MIGLIDRARLLIVLGLTGFLLTGCLGDPAPKLDFTNIEGKKITAESYSGEVFLVNFWATSCTTCVKEMPQIVSLYEQFKDKGFRTFAVAMKYDRPDYVVNFKETRNLPFDVILDLDGNIAKAYKDVQLTPTTYLVDRQGQIVKTYVGEPDFDALSALIEKKLAEPQA
ncbi:MAG: TlpA disulfide reductase family protein [Limnobacter sp.]|nr:TlpA disulfide reductase family protein [Limnobacter sp.]